MAQTINYGIIGCGMMGLEHIENIKLLPDTRVSAFVEPDDMMAQAAQQHAPEAERCADIKTLLAKPDLDALVVVSPNYLHVDQLAEIAALRPLPLLMEKPLYTNPADASRVTAFEKDYAAPVWVAMEYRYMPPIAAFLAEADHATGGIKMLTIREHRFPFLPKIGNWNRFNTQTGGTLVEKCCHFFDLMRLVLRSEPVRVMASGDQAVNHLGETYDGQTSDIWDNAYVIVDFANGARAMLELCMFAEGSRYQEEISAVGPDGKIECLVPGPGRFWPAKLGNAPIPQLIVSPRSPKGPVVKDIPVDPALLAAGDHNGATFYQHQRFNDVVRGLAQPEVTMTDGACAVAMGMAAQRSALEGKTILL